MTSESHNLIAYGVLEPQHHAHAYYHHRQSDSHSRHGNAYCGFGHFLLVADMVGVDAAGNKKRKVHCFSV